MSFQIDELCSARYMGTLFDETNSPFGGIETLTLTLYNRLDGTIINNRNAQNVFNANQVTFDTLSGLITWNLLPADNALTVGTVVQEDHVALFIATWQSGAKRLNHEVLITVRNLKKLGTE